MNATSRPEAARQSSVEIDETTLPADADNRPLVIRWRHALGLDASVRALEHHIGLTLSAFMNRDGETWVGVGTLAEHAKRDRRSVQRALKELRKRGWLTVVDGGGRSNTSARFARFPDRKKRHLAAVTGKGGISSANTGVLPSAPTAASDPERAAFDPEKGGVTPPEVKEVNEDEEASG